MSTRSSEVGASLHLPWRSLTPSDLLLGVDQRKLFTAAKEWLPKLGYRQVCAAQFLYFPDRIQLTYFQRAHLMNPMIPGLHGGKSTFLLLR